MTRQAPTHHDGSVPLRRVVAAVLEQVGVLTGRRPDGVSGVRRTDDGWQLTVDVVDLERIPATTSVLATLEVEADADGNVIQYERVRRYYRNAADDS